MAKAPGKANLPAQWNVADAEEFDGGGNIVNKAELVGVPFLIGAVAFRKGDFGPYVSVTAVDQENNEFVFNDGSTGVYAQLVAWLHKHGDLSQDITKPDMQEYDGMRLICRRGLRKSEYEGPGGKPASTYYLA